VLPVSYCSRVFVCIVPGWESGWPQPWGRWVRTWHSLGHKASLLAGTLTLVLSAPRFHLLPNLKHCSCTVVPRGFCVACSGRYFAHIGTTFAYYLACALSYFEFVGARLFHPCALTAGAQRVDAYC